MSATPPGWYPDTAGQQRWWDGTRWTDQVQQQGPPGWQPAPPGSTGGPSGRGKGPLIAVLVGGAAVVIGVVVLLVVLLGGDDGGGGGGNGGEAADGPEETVRAVFDDLISGGCDYLDKISNDDLDTDEAGRDAAVEDARTQCEEYADETEADGVGCELELSDETVVTEDEEITFDYEVVGCDDPDENEEPNSITVVKENDEWRLDER